MDQKVCDKCHNVIEGYDVPHYVSVQKEDDKGEMKMAMPSLEVCPQCSVEIQKIIRAYDPHEVPDGGT